MNASLSVIATSSLWDRTIALLSTSCLKHYDFSIFSHEDESFKSTYNFDQLTVASWKTQTKSILPGLLDNLIRINGKLDNLDFISPRALSLGELSVISKHYRAINNFLGSDNSQLLIMEDDVIFNESSFDSIDKFVSSNRFDFVDFAGGDGINCNPDKLQCVEGITGETINLKSTRTACCYMISKKFAYHLASCLSTPVLPIDWSISYALSVFQDASVFWVDDKIFSHGSCVGLHTSWRS